MLRVDSDGLLVDPGGQLGVGAVVVGSTREAGARGGVVSDHGGWSRARMWSSVSALGLAKTWARPQGLSTDGQRPAAGRLACSTSAKPDVRSKRRAFAVRRRRRLKPCPVSNPLL